MQPLRVRDPAHRPLRTALPHRPEHLQILRMIFSFTLINGSLTPTAQIEKPLLRKNVRTLRAVLVQPTRTPRPQKTKNTLSPQQKLIPPCDTQTQRK